MSNTWRRAAPLVSGAARRTVWAPSASPYASRRMSFAARAIGAPFAGCPTPCVHAGHVVCRRGARSEHLEGTELSQRIRLIDGERRMWRNASPVLRFGSRRRLRERKAVLRFRSSGARGLAHAPAKTRTSSSAPAAQATASAMGLEAGSLVRFAQGPGTARLAAVIRAPAEPRTNTSRIHAVPKFCRKPHPRLHQFFEMHAPAACRVRSCGHSLFHVQREQARSSSVNRDVSVKGTPSR